MQLIAVPQAAAVSSATCSRLLCCCSCLCDGRVCIDGFVVENVPSGNGTTPQPAAYVRPGKAQRKLIVESHVQAQVAKQAQGANEEAQGPVGTQVTHWFLWQHLVFVLHGFV